VPCLLPTRQSGHLFRLSAPPLQVELVFCMAEALGVTGRARHSTRHPHTQAVAGRKHACGALFDRLALAVQAIYDSEYDRATGRLHSPLLLLLIVIAAVATVFLFFCVVVCVVVVIAVVVVVVVVIVGWIVVVWCWC